MLISIVNLCKVHMIFGIAYKIEKKAYITLIINRKNVFPYIVTRFNILYDLFSIQLFQLCLESAIDANFATNYAACENSYILYKKRNVKI